MPPTLEAHVHHEPTPSNLMDGGLPSEGPSIPDGDPSAAVVAVNGVMPIAIVGMACRLSGGVSTPDDLYQMCAQGRSGWSTIPTDRFNAAGFYHPNPEKAGCSNVQGAHFLQQDISTFDAPFFGITASEAKAIDPQQRLLLECTYEALENGGIPLHSISGRNVGVFTGFSFSDYGVHLHRDPEQAPRTQFTGCADALQANRISYHFNLKGPSCNVDTACSSSFYAMHLACQSLRTGECSQAIVGSSHLNLDPSMWSVMSSARVLDPMGRCFSFDHRGGGFGRGEGVACVILKPLRDAIAAGDSIRAVIRNSGLNQDGRTSGISVPNPAAQEALIRSVYAGAQIEPRDTAYVEAHGTGTPTGDPLEAAALAAVFGRRNTSRDPLFVGSVKSNVGHLEGASGVTAIVKTAMMLERGTILPNANFEKYNEKVSFLEHNIMVPTSLISWPQCEVRRASVNNFGLGGSNAHFILEQPPLWTKSGLNANRTAANGMASIGTGLSGSPLLEPVDMSHDRLYVLTANDRDALKTQANRLASYLRRSLDVSVDISMSSLAFTLCERRSLLPWRLSVQASSAADLIIQLESGDEAQFLRSSREPRVGFVFTGQGAQWHGMGRELMRYPVFASSIWRAEKCLRDLGASWSLIDELYGDSNTSSIGRSWVSQPACTALQLALIDLLSSWKIRPAAVTGHSSGEIAAAYAAGALDMDTCLSLAYHRGAVTARLKQRYPDLQGAMMAVGLSQAEAQKLLEAVSHGRATVACVNSPTSVTLSGDEEAISQLQMLAEEKKVFNRRLRVDIAYHSHHMEYVANEYLSLIGQVEPGPSLSTEFYSSLTGSHLGAKALGPSYWVKNLTSPVLFSQALQELCGASQTEVSDDRQIDILVEIGPHAALEGPVQQVIKTHVGRVRKPVYLPTLVRNKNALETILQLASALFIRGLNIDFSTINFLGSNEEMKVLTDLPTYPWKHTESYWHETRLTKQYRSRAYAPHYLLGVLLPTCNDLEPTWRNVLRVDDVPWLRHHRVQSNNVFPMAGYVSLAVEAAHRRAMSRDVKILKYELREVTADRALFIPDSVDVEIMISLRPYNLGTRTSSDLWDEFRIFSWTSSKGWLEHSRGLIAVRTDNEPQSAASPSDGKVTGGSLSDSLANINAACKYPLDTDKSYETLDSIGLQYGSTFRARIETRVGPNEGFCRVIIPDTAAVMPYNHEDSLVIHPATLDACFQSSLTVVIGTPTAFRRSRDMRPYMPSLIRSMTIQHGIVKQPGKALDVYAQLLQTSSRMTSVSLLVVDPRNNFQEPAVAINGLELTPLATDVITARDHLERQLCQKFEWKPHVDLVRKWQWSSVLQLPPPRPEEKTKLRVLEQASFYFIKDAVAQLAQDDRGHFAKHHQKCYQWMEKVTQQAQSGDLPMQTREWMNGDARRHREMARWLGAQGALICAIGENLVPILRGEIEPLSIMLKDNLLESNYSDLEFYGRNYARAAKFIDLVAHQNPHLRLIELGAGTGGATLPILKTLGATGDGASRFSRYDYTDISVAFFENAKIRFQDWDHLIHYGKLDIEHDPSDQGYEAHSYDVVIASNVLHATASMHRTMHNVRKLLRPGGKLVLIESTVQTLKHLPFTTLPGWWLGEEPYRSERPILHTEEWDQVLRETGFSGIDFIQQDYAGEPERMDGVIVSTCVLPEYEVYPAVTVVQLKGPNCLPLEKLQESLAILTGDVPVIDSLAQVDAAGKVCVILADADGAFLAGLEPDEFTALQRLFSTAKGVLWVVQGASIDSTSPNANMAVGLSRAIRNEIGGITLVTLDLSNRERSTESQTVETVVDTFKMAFGPDRGSPERDLEFSERDGLLLIPRLVLNPEANDFIRRQTQPPTPQLQPYWQEGRALALDVGTPGLLDTLRFVEDESCAAPLRENEVEITVKACGLNFRDIMWAMGQLQIDTLAGEFSGIVTAVGSQVSRVAVGDRVASVGGSPGSSLVRSSEFLATRIPDDMSFTVAASFFTVYATAYYSLIDVARLAPGESILIHSAAGGVGQAAIILSQMVGAKIFATVGTPEKRDLLVRTYGIPEDQIFSSRGTSFRTKIMSATKGKGVDVALNSLAGEALRVTFECIAPFGRFVEIGKRDFESNTRLEMAPFAKNVTFAAVDLQLMYSQRPETVARLNGQLLELFRQGAIRPVSPLITFSAADVEKAFRLMQSGKHTGKIIIEPRPDDQVMVLPRRTAPSMIRSDATYLITGGTGGLGRSICKWLAQNGAKHIVLVSRSGLAVAAAQRLVDELNALGVQVHVHKCDVGDKEQLQTVIRETLDANPPIRGVFHGAMALHDALFEQSSYEGYVKVIRPKVYGAWNLHHLLRRHDLDFFVSLSSAAGILGNRGQAAYSATSTFLDAFARYQVSQGLQAVSIDLGVVSEVGYVAELDVKVDIETDVVNEEEVHALCHAAIAGEFWKDCGSQCVVGLAGEKASSSFWAVDAKFAYIRRLRSSDEGSNERSVAQNISIGHLLKQARSTDEATQVVCQAIVEKVSGMLMLPVEEISPSRPLVAYGLDSLVSVEIRNWMAREMDASMALLDLMSSESITQLAEMVVHKSALVNLQTMKTDKENEETQKVET